MSSLFDSDDEDFGPSVGAGGAVENNQQVSESGLETEPAVASVKDLHDEEELEDQTSDLEQQQQHQQQNQLDDLVDEEDEDDFGGGIGSQPPPVEGDQLDDMQDELIDEDVGDEQLDTQASQPQFDDFDELDDEDEDGMDKKRDDEPEVVDFNAEPGMHQEEQQQKKQKKNLGPPMVINVPLVNHPDPSKLKNVRFSQFVGMEPRVFDEENFNPLEELYTIIRWRWLADNNGGQQQKESNTKWIKWSDGSESLSIGDEVFDLQDLDISNQNMYLFARHHGLIQGVCHLKTRSSLRAVNMDIQAQKRLEQIMELKAGSRTQKVKTVTKLKDPETQQRQMEILEQQRIKERELMQQRRQKAEMRSSTGRKSGLNRQYLEEDDDGDYAGNNRSSFSRGARDAIQEARTESRLQRAKRDREEDNMEDKQPKAKRGVVLDSSDDDDF